MALTMKGKTTYLQIYQYQDARKAFVGTGFFSAPDGAYFLRRNKAGGKWE
tara:strand:- start:2107 stop:2256 length:150 start_codon:yes stop_codon:yes gene_type:complete